MSIWDDKAILVDGLDARLYRRRSMEFREPWQKAGWLMIYRELESLETA